MILVATTTLGTACSIYSQFFTSSASQVGLAIVMREIYRYIYLFLFPTKLFPIVSPSSFKISFQIPRSLARIDRHFQFLSFLPPPLTNDSPRLDVALTVSSSHRRLTRERGGGGEREKVRSVERSFRFFRPMQQRGKENEEFSFSSSRGPLGPSNEGGGGNCVKVDVGCTRAAPLSVDAE